MKDLLLKRIIEFKFPFYTDNNINETSEILKELADADNYIGSIEKKTEEELRKIMLRSSIKFNPSNNVFVKKEFYTHFLRGDLDIFSTNKVYSLYQASLGKGNKPLFIKTKYTLTLGDNNLFLKKLTKEELNKLVYEMDNFAFGELISSLKIRINQKEDTFEDVVEKILTYNNLFFEPILPISEIEIQKLGNPLQNCKQILKEGTTQIDEELVDSYLADIPEIEPSFIKPRNYVPHSPNKIIIANGGIGKTTLAYKVSGESGLEKPTEANLLGFATADKKIEGYLHNRIKQTYVEELNEEKNNELFGKVHTYMEQGSMDIGRGIGIKLLGYSGITFQGNPKRKNIDSSNDLNDYVIIKEFTDFLTKISDNCEPFGRRIGQLIFDKKLTVVKGNLDSIRTEEGVSIIRTYAEGFREPFTKLFLDKFVLAWLNKSFSKNYIDIMNKFISQTGDFQVQEFLKGQINSFRHARGIAIRLAWLDVGLEYYWKNNSFNSEILIESAEEHLRKILNRNIKSFQNIISSLNSHVYSDIQKYHLFSLKPEYMKLAVYSLFEKFVELNSKEKLIPLTALDNYFSVIRKRLSIDSKSKNGVFSNIVNALKKRTDFSELGVFGLDFDLKKECFVILNVDLFNTFLNFYKVEKVEKVEQNKESAKSSKVEKVEKVEKKSKFLPFRPSTLGNEEKIFEINSIRDVLTFLKNNPTNFNKLLSSCSKSEEWLMDSLATLSAQGEIFEQPKDNWRLVE